MGGLRFLTAGESHGPSLGVTIEGVPAGLRITADDLAVDLARRQRGYGRGARQTIEQDRAEILGGVRHGLTLGSPILLLVRNRDWENWTRVMSVEPLDDEAARALSAAAADGNKRATPVTRVRPGHADLAGALKYGFNDVRNVLERASARETAARVAAGGVARAFLRELGIETWSFTAEVGGVAVDPAACTRPRDEADASPLRCPDPAAEARMIARIDEARSAGDTVGGVFEVVVHGLPIGLGSYVHWDRRLDAALAAAVMSINIVKGVEFGLGFEQTRRFGSGVHDVIEGRTDDGRWVHRTNNAGGLTGGVTNGEPLVVRGAVKPISTLARPLPSADLVTGEAVDKAHYERSDISVVPAAGVVAEAMVMLTLAELRPREVRRRHARRRARRPGPLPGTDRDGARCAGRRRATSDGDCGHGGDPGTRGARLDRHGRGRLRRRRLTPWTSSCRAARERQERRREAPRQPARRRPSSTSTSESSRAPAGPSPRSSKRTARRPSGRSSGRPITELGPADRAPDIRRVIATGGGAVVDPRNRWALFRGRTVAWLDGRPEVLAQRLRRSPNVRPLVAGRDPIGAIRDLAARRERFYAAAHVHQSGVAEVRGVVEALEERLPTADAVAAAGTTLLRASTPIGRIVLGEGIAGRGPRARS